MWSHCPAQAPAPKPDKQVSLMTTTPTGWQAILLKPQLTQGLVGHSAVLYKVPAAADPQIGSFYTRTLHVHACSWTPIAYFADCAKDLC